ncbi:unnamed protein product, partial [Acidithrix sp. C25]
VNVKLTAKKMHMGNHTRASSSALVNNSQMPPPLPPPWP